MLRIKLNYEQKKKENQHFTRIILTYEEKRFTKHFCIVIQL